MLKLCTIRACASGTLGLHLSRAPWDPYPWVSGIQAGSSAQGAGLRVGDTVLELNGCDVLGQKILEIASRIREHWQSGATSVTLVIWRNDSEVDSDGDVDGEEDDAAADDDRREERRQQQQQQRPHHGINQQSLQKFATCLQHIAQLLECPVCLEVIKPPGWQCCNGHVMCNNCRSRSVKCPVCRVPLGPRGRCLLSDKLFTLLAESFPCDNGRSSSRKSPKDKRRCSTDFSHSPTTTTTAALQQQIKAKEINKKVKSFGQQDGKVDKPCVALASRRVGGSDGAQRRSSDEQSVEEIGGNQTPTNGNGGDGDGGSERMLPSAFLQQRRSRAGKIAPEAKGAMDEIKLLKSCEDEQLSGSDSSSSDGNETTATEGTRASGNVGGGGDGSVGDVTDTTSRYNNVLVKLKLKSSKKCAECSVAATAAAHC